MSENTAVGLTFNPETMRPLIEQVVEQVVERLEAERAKLGTRLAYSEREAAELLGMAQHQLRDERHRGAIESSLVAGGRVRYTPDDLARYLRSRRYVPTKKA